MDSLDALGSLIPRLGFFLKECSESQQGYLSIPTLEVFDPKTRRVAGGGEGGRHKKRQRKRWVPHVTINWYDS